MKTIKYYVLILCALSVPALASDDDALNHDMLKEAWNGATAANVADISGNWVMGECYLQNSLPVDSILVSVTEPSEIYGPAFTAYKYRIDVVNKNSYRGQTPKEIARHLRNSGVLKFTHFSQVNNGDSDGTGWGEDSLNTEGGDYNRGYYYLKKGPVKADGPAHLLLKVKPHTTFNKGENYFCHYFKQIKQPNN